LRSLAIRPLQTLTPQKFLEEKNWANWPAANSNLIKSNATRGVAWRGVGVSPRLSY